MFKVYGDYRSGNCYKIKLLLELLNLPYEWVARHSWPRILTARSQCWS